MANLKKTVEAITARKVNEESAFAIVSLSNNNLRDLTTWDSAHIFRDYDIIWSRIADALAQYDYHVLFEAYDQIPNTGNHTDVVLYSRLNQIFVDAVRHTGANITNCPFSHLIISPCATKWRDILSNTW